MSSTIYEIFATLTKGARAALPFLRAAAETTKTTTEILEEAKSLGFAFRRQAGLDIIGTLRNNVTAARAIRLAAPDVPLNPITYGESIGKLKRAFSYTVKIATRDADGNRTDPKFVTISSNTPLSINQITDKAEEEGFVATYSNGEEVIDTTVVDALRDASTGSEIAFNMYPEVPPLGTDLE
jgi:hypothetical protein